MWGFKITSIIILILPAQMLFSQAGSQDSSVSFKVSGTCGQCKQRIEKAVKIKGVHSPSWNIKSKMLSLTFDPSLISLEKIHTIIANTGHDTEKKKAKDQVYKSLPECCLYREITDATHIENREPGSEKDIIYGLVVESVNDQLHPLNGTTISSIDNSNVTVTNVHGEFLLSSTAGIDQLIISYAGFKPDTISLNGMKDIQITLSRNENAQGVIISARPRPYYIQSSGAFRTSIITKTELLKAACCNLSESFETNPSVDVSSSDAATGSKQIQLLGLAGVYTQLTVENLPGPRGIATHLGLNSIAGPWIESIQIIKGTGSVVNGFESMAGQINVELRKPRNSEKLYLNGYVNSMGKMDLNLNWAHKLNSKWSTGFLLHDDLLTNKEDFNDDGFADLPTGNLFSGIHRWQYQGENGLISHFGIKFLSDNRTGGEEDFEPTTDKFTTHHYGLGIRTNRFEVFSKTGYVFPGKKYKSLGLQVSAFTHQQESYFGLTRYDADQTNFYSNLIYQTRIGSEMNTIKTGLSILYDKYTEQVNNLNYDRKEIVPGAFAEYTYKPNEKFDLVAGIRMDHNNLYGWFATPRLNMRFAPFSKTTIRVNAGRGQRTANIFAENTGLFVSSREMKITGAVNGKAYGLKPEIAWNEGISIDQKFRIFNKEASIAFDYYHIDFVNQVVIDLENPREVNFYNLQGKSFTNSFQGEINFMPVKKLEVRLAYRYFDVKSTYKEKLLEKALIARHRAFANIAYDLKGWSMDLTVNLTGKKRIPSTIQNPDHLQLPACSPSYVTMNAQVSKSIGKQKRLEFYAGAENLGNYFQEMIILSADQPFSDYFDASMIWGPISERTLYAGFRFSIK